MRSLGAGFALAAATAAAYPSVLSLEARAQQAVDCWLNERKQTCVVAHWRNNGLEITFSAGAIFRFVPAGTPTTDNRRMRDEQGRLWLMSGHHSFTLREENGDGNLIVVSSVKTTAAEMRPHQPYSKVKLVGHLRPTVPLYERPSYDAQLSGMGVSGETLNKISCTTNGQGHWCRVGYPGQSGRVLWANTDSLQFLSDGE
jgi:hypothetical protein